MKQPDQGSTRRRAATYRWVATNEPLNEGRLSGQPAALTRFARLNDLHVVADHEDVGPGTALDRPGLNRAIDGARRGDFEVLLVHSADNLARDVLVAFTIVDQFTAIGVKVMSATESWDLTDRKNRVREAFCAMSARLMREILSERIRSALATKRSEGKWIAGRPPFGYKLDPVRQALVIDPATAAVVQGAFEKVAIEKCTVLTVRDWLNETGWRTSRGAAWSTPTVRTLLHNPVYRGLIVQKEEVHPGLHQAIINQELWDAVHEVIG